MNSELRELFEIKQDDGKKKISKPDPGDQNVKKHITNRLAVFILGTICFVIAINTGKGSWEEVAFLIFMAIFHAIWLLFIIIEAVVLQSKKKFALRNINLIFILILLLTYFISGIFLFGFA
ncbi:hypothetical protein [Chryseobacterium sp. W4I1]|uniref:hypothetical protein n=1 Tax=Chryseobacterium sp. W4I1 TaxID=3042293 RepID=UPI0027809467|nr:hypothetical protein [Chryseobacterium sp. W4I1]MDQ0781977.1 heme/copper-type cytochrome/quinol oxidase subunit 4 [Chryseobacterium sp. W4I1]